MDNDLAMGGQGTPAGEPTATEQQAVAPAGQAGAMPPATGAMPPATEATTTEAGIGQPSAGVAAEPVATESAAPNAGEPTAAESAVPEAGEPAVEQDPKPKTWPRKALWAAIALLCVLAGAAGSLLVAHSLANRQINAERSAFQANSAQIASSLNSAAQRDRGLVISAGSLLAGNPRVSASEFAAWTSWAHVLARYPELQRLSLVSAHGKSLSLARFPARRGRTWTQQTVVYRGIATPVTESGRKKAFAGWVHAITRPGVLLRIALASHPGYGALLGSGRSPDPVAYAGQIHATGSQIEVRRLANGWRLENVGPPATAQLLAKGRMWVLVAGLLIGALLGALALSLGLRRAPAPVVIEVPSPAPELPAVETLYDPLTELPNKALTLDRAVGMLARADRQSGTLVGALLIDIDWFKDINEKLGHAAGDQVLKIVAGRLGDTMRSQDTVGRLEGDQFVVLVECSARSVRLDSLAQRVIESLHKPIELEGFGPSFFMTASVGVSLGRYETPDELLRDARLALQTAKGAGRDRYALFNASTSSVVEGRSTQETELNAAVQEGQFFLVFEPIWDLGTHTVLGMQAQPRWQHPQRGVLAAEDFVPLAEDNGLIVPIDRWALEEACNRAASWEVQGRQIGVSVRVAADQINREGLVTDIRRALQQSGLAPSLLTIEITETAVMRDVAAAAERLNEIKQLGVHLAIADFGASGYAYHSDLRRLPLDCLRVDKGALASADDSEYRDWLMEAILMVGRELSLQVIAENVESAEQLDALQSMGCRRAQGPFLGGAVPAAGVIGVCDGSVPAPTSSVASTSPTAPISTAAPTSMTPAAPATQPS